MTEIIRGSQDQKIPMRNFQLYVIEDLAVVRRFQQSMRLRKRQSLHEASFKLRRQTCAAFGTTTGQYLAAVSSRHTGTETVNALALQDAWLKCSFHGDDLTNRQWTWGDWLENRQSKQERHSSQILREVQCLSDSELKFSAWVMSARLTNRIYKSFLNSFKDYLLLLLRTMFSVEKP